MVDELENASLLTEVIAIKTPAKAACTLTTLTIFEDPKIVFFNLGKKS